MPVITDLALLKHRRTKIIATLGPASCKPAVIERLIQAGVNVMRLNMSHGDQTGHAQVYALIRSIAERLGVPVTIFADLCGPKIRVGCFPAGPVLLTTGDTVTVTTRDVPGGPGLIPSQYEGLAHDVHGGDHILLDDGNLELAVVSVTGTEILTQVVTGGVLKSHKGINLPGVSISAPSLSAKDREDARFALHLGVDYLALSFVRCADDVRALRALIGSLGCDSGIIAKIEKPEALQNASEILSVSDAIMVARGDLGVELHPEQVPVAQRQLIDRARQFNRPVIVATQMLESMVEHPRPTRAEVSDVAAAVAAGADAVMLSAETASGKYPIEAVEMMERIARQTEAFEFWRRKNRHGITAAGSSTRQGLTPFGDALADAAARLIYDTDARAVVVLSQSGMSAVTISASRPWAPVVGVTGSIQTWHRMNLMWGVIPVLAPDAGSRNPNQIARRVARDLGIAQSGDFIVLVRGFHHDPARSTPSITLLVV